MATSTSVSTSASTSASAIDPAILTDTDCVAFGGGGLRGFAYLGALKALRDRFGVDWGRQRPRKLRAAAGTSIGAFLSLLLVLGYSVDEIVATVMDVHIGRLFEPNVSLLLDPKVMALDDGSEVEAEIERALERKDIPPSLTMAQLLRRSRGVHWIACVCVLEREQLLFVSTARPEHAHLRVIDVVRASMALPIIFAPVRMPASLSSSSSSAAASLSSSSSTTTAMETWVDGGLLEGMPMAVFDPRTTRAFGFRLLVRPPSTAPLSSSTSVVARPTQGIANLFKRCLGAVFRVMTTATDTTLAPYRGRVLEIETTDEIVPRSLGPEEIRHIVEDGTRSVVAMIHATTPPPSATSSPSSSASSSESPTTETATDAVVVKPPTDSDAAVHSRDEAEEVVVCVCDSPTSSSTPSSCVWRDPWTFR